MKNSKEKGITLIALIITIIVLLILVGVSLSMVVGDNGILNQAINSSVKTDIADTKEQIEVKLTNYWDEEAKYTVDDVVSAAYEVTGNEVDIENETVLSAKGNVVDISDLIAGASDSTLDWDKIVANLEDDDAREEYLEEAISLGQDSSNEDVGIGTDGSVVDLDLWNYSRTNDGNSVQLQSVEASGTSEYAYKNENIQASGTIQGMVPQYIYLSAYDKVFEVTKMTNAFANCTNLIIAPEIPSTITDMERTFYGCTNLTTAPTISSSVTNMYQTFYNCSSLTGTMEIDADPTTITDVFYYAAINDNCKLYLTGNSSMLIDFIETKSNINSKIYLLCDESNLIEFTLDEETCYAEEGMSWKEWFYCNYYSGPELWEETELDLSTSGTLSFTDYNTWYCHISTSAVGTYLVNCDDEIIEGNAYYVIRTQ